MNGPPRAAPQVRGEGCVQRALEAASAEVLRAGSFKKHAAAQKKAGTWPLSCGASAAGLPGVQAGRASSVQGEALAR